MLRNILCFLSLSVLLAGCEVTEQVAIETATEMVATKLKDPSSAKFSDVKFIRNSEIGETSYGYICGVVNSHNSFGGYTGGIRFLADMNYSKSGRIAVSNLELEEGSKAENFSDGITYFEHFYWNRKCVRAASVAESWAKQDAKVEVSTGMISKPVKNTVFTRSLPDVAAPEADQIKPGEVVTAYDVKDGWVRVSKDGSAPRWAMSILLNW
jgi:hypothetical protein